MAKRGSAGGVARGKMSHAAAVARYMAAPNHCLNCRQVIVPADKRGGLAEARKKTFCGHRCSALFNAPAVAAKVREWRGSKPPACADCGVPVKQKPSGKAPKWCEPCREARSPWRRQRGQVSHRYLRTHSRQVLMATDRPRVCEGCGYDRHVEVAHRIPVKCFSGTAKLSEVNAVSNLMFLCPNCHWEHDHPEVLVRGSACSSTS